ncbi:TonB-dependent receptor [Vibrio cholerae]
MNKIAVFAAISSGAFGAFPVLGADNVNETVIVQATRVEKDIKDVPQSIDVLTSEEINTQRHRTVADAIKAIPNITLSDIAGDYNYVQIRGLPRNLEQANVPIYVDGVPQTSLYGLNLSLLDVESIEFLRGPQGNIYGSNARDGIIVITTKKPANEPTASVKVGSANYDEKSAQLLASSALIDDVLSAKIAINHLKRGGFVENTYLDKSVDDKTQNNLALSFYWTPDTDWSASLYMDYGETDGGAYPYVPGTSQPNRGDDIQTAMDVDGVFEQKSKGVALNLGWDFHPEWAFNSVTGYRSINTFGRFDADLAVTPAAMSMLVDTWLDEEDYFQELRLTSTPGVLPVDWIVGAAYYRVTENNRNRAAMTLMDMDLTKVAGDYSRDTYTAYVDVIWRFAPTWTVNVGGRYTKENYEIDSAFYNLFLNPAQTQGDYSTDYDEFLPKLAISKDFGRDHTLYASYGEGLLSGGGSWMAEETTVSGERLGYGKTYEPETSEVFEFGYKSYWLDRTVMANINLFEARVNNYQYAYPDAGGNARIASIQEVRSRGVEGSISALLTEAWQAALRFGFNDAKITQVDGYTGASMAQGNRVPYAPKYDVHLESTYLAQLSDDWGFTPSISVSHFGEVAQDGQGKRFQDPYWVVNANLNFTYRDDYSIRVWGANLTDERYQTYSVNWGGTDYSTYGEPLRFGLDLEAKF